MVLLGTLLSSPQAQGVDAGVAGVWRGTWSRDGDTLQVSVEFRRQGDGWAGSFDSDRLRVVGIPFRDVSVVPPKVTWKLVGDATTMSFAGELKGDTLSGEFTEGAARGTFHLQRASNDTQPVRERPLLFHNGDVALAGTLLLPPTSAKKVPAVVFAHGSGGEGRWASKYLATRFANGGIAALIFDKRGVGESRGDWRMATVEELAGDAAAAVSALQKDPEIDPALVGIHGHSQGGTLAPLIATKARVAFVIASAAAGLPLDEVEIYSLESSVNVAELPAEDAALARRYIAALVGVAYRGEPRQQLDSLWPLVREKKWAFPPPPQDSHYWRFSRDFHTYDSPGHWRRLDVPVLLLYGELDQRVPARRSAARIAQALLEGRGNSATVQIFENADHAFRVASPNLVWPNTAPGYSDVLIEWARRITGVAGVPAR